MSKLKVDQLEEVTGGANVTVSAGSDLIVDDNLYVVGYITGSGHISGSSSSTGSFGRVETGNLTVGGSQGSDGEVLTSTGTGVAWEAAGGGVDGIVSTASATAMTIDSNNNIRLGGAAAGNENFSWDSVNVLSFGADYNWGGGAVWAYAQTMFDPHFNISENVYFNGMYDAYIDTNYASLYRQQQGTHTFKVAGSGTADNAISWTTALEIKNDGRGLSQFTAKAWAYFDGTGTPSFHDSYNCSTITDHTVGTYSINFTNNLGSADYAAVASAGYTQDGPYGPAKKDAVTNLDGDSTAALCKMLVNRQDGSQSSIVDDDNISLIVFGD